MPIQPDELLALAPELWLAGVGLALVVLDLFVAEDRKIVREMIEAHVQYTGSRHAQRLLDAWETMQEKFVRVMPRDYKRVLAERARQETMFTAQQA